MLEREAEARAGEVELAKVDVDANQELAGRYDVRGIPAVKAFRNGQVVARVRRRAAACGGRGVLRRADGSVRLAEQLAEELRASGELPDVAAALESGDYERAFELLLDEVAAAEGERREWLRERLVSLFGGLGPRASADGALPAAARVDALLSGR